MRLRAFIRLFLLSLSDRSGQFAIGFALLMPLLLGLAGGAVDFVAFERNMKRMQDVADNAALAAAREGLLQGWNQQIASEVALKFASENLGQPVLSSDLAKTQSSSPGGEYRINTVVDVVNKTVSVTIENDHFPYFYLGYFRHSPQISVNAKANVTGDMNICVVGLDLVSSGAFQLTNFAKITAPGCAIYSNSTHPSGFIAKDASYLESAFNCSAGGFEGASKNVSSVPVPDCRPIDDPLAARGVPSVSKCDYKDLVVSNANMVLKPGVYCGGILATDKSNAVFEPGIYVIHNGELKFDKGGMVTGQGVSFIFTGTSKLTFDETTEMALSAPEAGPYAGILFYQDPKAAVLETFEISSKKAGVMLGTIYLPNGIFKVHANNKVGDQSAYTVVIARKLDVGANADLVINTDYAATKVPVPAGVGPQGSRILLVR